MAYKLSQDTQPAYLDGISVKISEKYKPPPRINLAITYSQRLSLNNQIQEDLSDYDFSLENTVKEKLKELRNARQLVREMRKARLEQLKEQRRKSENDLENEEQVGDNDTENEEFHYQRIGTKEVCNSTANILIPMQVNTDSYILKPTPLKVKQEISATNDKSPFNISDFEADTSSPFDNMELKTLNDIEELAQVLKKDEKSNYVPMSTHSTLSLQNSQYFAQYPYVTQATMNGYYNSTTNQNLRSYSYNNFQPVASTSDISDNTRNVNDIIQSLQADLDNMHVSTNLKPIEDRTCTNNLELLSDPCDSLSQDWKILSQRISLMGFPLPRVARICKLLDGDQKKVVEHLLVMSELLDLGFPEEQVSNALLQCNNDRDKALDILIS